MAKGKGGGAPIGNKNAAGPRTSKPKTIANSKVKRLPSASVSKSTAVPAKAGGWFSRAIDNFNKQSDKAFLETQYARLNEKSNGVYAALVQQGVTKIPEKGLSIPGYPKVSNSEFQQFRKVIEDYGKL